MRADCTGLAVLGCHKQSGKIYIYNGGSPLMPEGVGGEFLCLAGMLPRWGGVWVAV